jgi:hypothetical protein
MSGIEELFQYRDKHLRVSSLREAPSSEIGRYWPILLVEWTVITGPDGCSLPEPLTETVLARLTLQDAKDLIVLLQEDVERVEASAEAERIRQLAAA